MIKNTPPMGWNSWNTFGADINEQLIKDTADKMVENGLLTAGYTYLVIDDCWSKKERDENGRLVADPEKFPNGMKAVADYVHSKGLKFGMYSCAGNLTCAGYPGSYEKGKVITGIEDAEAMENVTVYHAGTAVVDGQLVTNGGRVLAVTALGDTFENARNLAYEACEKIDFEGKTLRHDIGLRALRGRDAWDA